MNISIKDIIAYEEQKKKKQQDELSQEREYAQVSYEIHPDEKKPKQEKEQQTCQVIITSL